MGEFSIGQSVRRREDPRLLMGRGRYFDDLNLAHQLYATIVRSPHAHADIRGIDASAALAMPGVQAVLTGADYAADGLGPLPAMVSAREAFEPGAPQLYDDCPKNEAYFYEAGDKAAVEAAFARAAHVVEQRLVINRVTANTIEPRGATGEYDTGTGRYTLHCGFQRPWLFREAIAKNVLKIPETQLRLITGDIGGSYGLRGSVYPELVLMPWAARRVGRPVKWIATRNEAHVSDDDARDNIVDAALALDC